MKTYRELYFRGSQEQLKGFVEEIKKYAVGEWKMEPQTDRWKEYLFFDYIINPLSLMYVPELLTVFRECHRVLHDKGVFIMMAPSPVNYLCDFSEDETGGYYKAVHRMPYCSTDHDNSGWVEYGHSMEEYLGGLTECGFLINGYMECQMADITELYFMARAIKNGR